MNIIVTSNNNFVPSLVLFPVKLGNDSIYYKEIFFLEPWSLRETNFAFSLPWENFEIPNLIKCSVVKTTKKNNFTLVDFDGTKVKYFLRELYIHYFPSILTLWKRLDLVWKQKSVLTIFVKTTERIKGAAIVEETESLREFRFIKIWESFPSILFNNISFALLSCFTLVYWTTTDKYLCEIWVYNTSKSCSWNKHVLFCNHFILVRCFVQDHLENWVERFFAWKILGPTNHEYSIIR